ncbi:phosphatidylethanolamine-binding protein 1-like [Schistocerca gregaria]|uniref:phosphatidylethanolamine-binding protein 1-like n=1 Tax=Schistocerca gregaria TaxID=7010 RepID=UPI00211F173F|nr:phosphatidylethanolamine-binding protein 1-like [Schistocerca gregaria]
MLSLAKATLQCLAGKVQFYCTAPKMSRPQLIHSRRLRRQERTKERQSQLRPLTSQTLKYLIQNQRLPSKKKKISKSHALVHKLVSIYPPPQEWDERRLSNKEYRKQKLGVETRKLAKYWGVIPDVIDSFTPSVNLCVQYPDERIVYRGNILKPEEVREKPSVTFCSPSRESYWTILMTDPDIPFKKSPTDQFNHYTIVNIPGNSIEKGRILADYLPSAPPSETGKHRYIFLLLKQLDGETNFDENLSMSDPSNRIFDVRDWIKRYKLSPKGLAFYRCEYNETVSEIYKAWNMLEPKVNFKDYQLRRPIVKRQYQYM